MKKVSLLLSCLGGSSRVAAANSAAKILLPEASDPRVQEAVNFVEEKQLAKVELVPQTSLDPEFLSPLVDAYLTLSPKLNRDLAVERLRDPLRIANLKVKLKQAGGVVAGCQRTTEDVVKTAIEFLRVPNTRVSSLFLMLKDSRPVAFADCAMNIHPTASELAQIAVQTSNSFRQLTGTKNPKVAFLSFSTGGSSKDKSVDFVRDAVEIARQMDSSSDFDGEIQFDAATIPEVAKMKRPDSLVAGRADVLIFPELNSGNIGYKIAERWGGAVAVGPILQGLSGPSNDLSRGCDAEDIVNMIIVTKLMSAKVENNNNDSVGEGAKRRGVIKGLEQRTTTWREKLSAEKKRGTVGVEKEK